MLNVLRAYALSDPDIGYTQGEAWGYAGSICTCLAAWLSALLCVALG